MMKCLKYVLILVLLLPCSTNLTFADSSLLQYPGTGNWYQRIDSPLLTWHAAENYCNDRQGHLATIASEGEDRFIFDNLISGQYDAWLGATDEDSEGTWRWVTNEPWIYTNWHQDEPNNCCPPEYCGGSSCTPEHYLRHFDSSTFGWNDLPNGTTRFICEWDSLVSMPVKINIHPDTTPNVINPKKMGVIPVAIMGDNSFDVTNVDVTTLRFGLLRALPAHNLEDLGKLEDHLKDVNNDGIIDLISHFTNGETGIDCNQTSIELQGETISGTPFAGVDTVFILGCE